MTDKEKRELKDGVISIFKRFNILDHTATIGNLRDDILKYINSLQEEHVNNDLEEVDLEEDVDRILEENNWDYDKIDFYEFAKYFYERGLNTRKENKL